HGLDPERVVDVPRLLCVDGHPLYFAAFHLASPIVTCTLSTTPGPHHARRAAQAATRVRYRVASNTLVRGTSSGPQSCSGSLRLSSKKPRSICTTYSIREHVSTGPPIQDG